MKCRVRQDYKGFVLRHVLVAQLPEEMREENATSWVYLNAVSMWTAFLASVALLGHISAIVTYL